MKELRNFLESIWLLMPKAQLASEYHPSTEGGNIPIPFIQSRKLLELKEPCEQPAGYPKINPPLRSFTSYIQGYSSLPLKDRALVALRSAYLCNARYLISDIFLCAQDTGYKQSDLQMISIGYRAPGWSRREKQLLQLTEHLYKEQALPHSLWKALARRYTPQQLLDLILCIAAFHLCVYPN